MHKIIFLILAVKCIFSDCLYSGDSPICVKQNDQNELFGLIWSDEFEGELDQDKWIVSNKNKSSCDDIFKCYHSQNVQIHNGLLILKASYDNNFAGAKLTTKQYFSHGRYEMRLIQPKANLKSCIYTWDPNNIDWRDSGRIVLTCNTVPNLYYYRSVYFGKNNDSRKFEAQLPGVAQVNENGFNLYGFEWTHNEIRFFFDDFYGSPIQLHGTNFNNYFQLRFLLRVTNHSPLVGPIATQLEELDWECPAFLIDYIRVYKQISSTTNDHKECSHSNKEYPKSDIDQICQKIYYNRLIPESNQISSKKTENTLIRDQTLLIVIFIGIFGVFLIFILYLSFQIQKIKKDKQVASPEPEYDYEYISDFELQPISGSHLVFRRSSLTPKTPSYISLQDENHEYVSMNTSL